jgi:hypothetical protein
MKFWSILLSLILLFAISTSAFAQDDEEERDLLEICFFGGVGSPMGGLGDWHDSLGAKLGWSAGMDFGYFMKPNLVVGVNFQYTQFGIDGPDAVKDASHRLYNPNLYAKYYFSGESDFEPYVKAHVGLENPKFTTSIENDARYRAISYDAVLAAGFGIGLFYYRTDYSGLFIEAGYNYADSKDIDRQFSGQTLTFDETIGVLDIHAGVRVLVGSGE